MHKTAVFNQGLCPAIGHRPLLFILRNMHPNLKKNRRCDGYCQGPGALVLVLVLVLGVPALRELFHFSGEMRIFWQLDYCLPL